MQESANDVAGRTAARQRGGVFYALGVYVLWGMLPAYFLILAPAGPFEIVGWRILFSLVFCALIITASRRWETLLGILRQPGLVLSLGLAAVLIVICWQVFAYAALNGKVLEIALGYFINPLVTVLLGVVFLRERLRRTQWIAVGISAAAVVLLAINYGSLPWVSVTLALSFGLYGLVKNRVGPRVDAITGLTIETAWLVPVAIAQLAFVGATSGIMLGTAGTFHTVMMLASGVLTAVPLLLFAAAANRLPLVYLGLIQYLSPVMQFLFGLFILHEAMPAERWIGFGLVWLALLILSVDIVLHGRALRRAVPLPA